MGSRIWVVIELGASRSCSVGDVSNPAAVGLGEVMTEFDDQIGQTEARDEPVMSGGGSLRRGWSWQPGGVGLSEVVAVNARRLRQERGWAQAELCRRLEPMLGREMSQPQVSSWEVHRQAMPLDFVALFASVFDVAMVELLRPSNDVSMPARLLADDGALRSATDDALLTEVRRRLASSARTVRRASSGESCNEAGRCGP